MFARLLTLTAALTFHFTAFAEQPVAQENELVPSVRLLLSCGELQAAKHIHVMVEASLAGLQEEVTVTDLEAYSNAMEQAKTCEDTQKAYKILTDLTVKLKMPNPEIFFATPEGMAELEALVAEIRKVLGRT